MALRHILFVAALVAAVSSAPQTPVFSQLDSVDVNALLANPEKVEGAFRCFLEDDDSSCDTEAKIMKSVTPELLKNNCDGCSESQRKRVTTFMVFASTKRPQEWAKMVAKYDPAGVARAKFGDAWRAHGISV